MPFRKDEIEIDGIGVVRLYQHWHNNRFQIGWGGSKDGAVYHMDNLIDVEFDTYVCGEWVVKQQKRTAGGLIDITVSKDIADNVIRSVLAVPSAKQAVEKYRKDAVKRLVKSVPRLKEEYEGSKERLEILQKVKF